MRLSTWIVTEVTPDDSQASVHFAVAVKAEKARDLVARRTRIEPKNLSVVRLRMDLSPVPRPWPRGAQPERYLGPLDQFSPFLRDACGSCRGTGKVVGSKPVEECPTCGGSGIKTVRRT
jgi:hypothetical protein